MRKKAETMVERIEELSAGWGSVRLPPRRDVRLSRRVMQLVDHPTFQRLRRVKQLGPLSLIYPGATHTRFEHSIGVYGVALVYLRALLRDPRSETLRAEDLEACLLAALLHDLGHYPYAHNLEASHIGDVQTPRHEELAHDLIYGRMAFGSSSGPSIAALIDRDFKVSAQEVLEVISAPLSSHSRVERRLMASVISSGIDADKSDYLERDAHHMGLPFGEQFDRQRMLSALVIHPLGDRIALTMNGRMAAESFVFARYAMFSEGYWHHAARAVAAMVEEALRDVRRSKRWDQDTLRHQIVQQDDAEFLAALRRDAGEGSAAAALLDRLTCGRRALYKRVLTLTLSFADPSLRTAYDRIYTLDRRHIDALRTLLRTVLEEISSRRIQPWEVLIDTPPRDKDHVEPISIVRGDRAEPLAQSSQIVRGIATDFVKVVKKIRVFVAPEVRDAALANISHVALEQRLVASILDFQVEKASQQPLFS